MPAKRSSTETRPSSPIHVTVSNAYDFRTTIVDPCHVATVKGYFPRETISYNFPPWFKNKHLLHVDCKYTESGNSFNLFLRAESMLKVIEKIPELRKKYLEAESQHQEDKENHLEKRFELAVKLDGEDHSLVMFGTNYTKAKFRYDYKSFNY